jgi:hypothetical protein
MQLPTCPRWAAPLSSFGVAVWAPQIVALVATLASASCRPLDDLDNARAGNRPEPVTLSADAGGASNTRGRAPPLEGAAGPDAAAGVDSPSLVPGAQPSALPGSGVAADAAAPEDASTRLNGSDSDPQPTGSRGELASPDGLDAGEAGAAPPLTPAVLPDAS